MTEPYTFNQPPRGDNAGPGYIRGGIEPGSPQDTATIDAPIDTHEMRQGPRLGRRIGAAGVAAAILIGGATVFGMNQSRGGGDASGRRAAPIQAPSTTEYQTPKQTPTSPNTAPTPQQTQAGANETSHDKTGVPDLPIEIEDTSYDELNTFAMAAAARMLERFGKANPAEVLNSGDPGAVSIIEIISVDGEMFVSGDESDPGEASVQIGYEAEGKQLLLTLKESRKATGAKKRTPQDFLFALENGEYRLVTIGFANEAEGTAG